jgi:hypothetical protein
MLPYPWSGMDDWFLQLLADTHPSSLKSTLSSSAFEMLWKRRYPELDNPWGSTAGKYTIEGVHLWLRGRRKIINLSSQAVNLLSEIEFRADSAPESDPKVVAANAAMFYVDIRSVAIPTFDGEDRKQFWKEQGPDMNAHMVFVQQRADKEGLHVWLWVRDGQTWASYVDVPTEFDDLTSMMLTQMALQPRPNKLLKTSEETRQFPVKTLMALTVATNAFKAMLEDPTVIMLGNRKKRQKRDRSYSSPKKIPALRLDVDGLRLITHRWNTEAKKGRGSEGEREFPNRKSPCLHEVDSFLRKTWVKEPAPGEEVVDTKEGKKGLLYMVMRPVTGHIRGKKLQPTHVRMRTSYIDDL